MNVEDNRHVYEGKDAFLRLYIPTSFSKPVHYKVLSFAYHKPSELGTWQGSRYFVSLAVDITYDCQIYQSM